MSDEEFTVTQHEWDLLVQRVAKLEQAAAQAEHTKEIAVADQGKKIARRRGHRLPEGWAPSTEIIIRMGVELRASSSALELEHRKFTDYWLSVPGQRGVKLDWERTWCNWMRTALERGGLRGHNGRNNDDKIRELMEMDVHAESE